MSRLTALWRQTDRFVGPVVLLKDFLRTILPAICKHHYHLIAVGPRGTALLWHSKREEHRERQVREQARAQGEGDHLCGTVVNMPKGMLKQDKTLHR